MPSSSSCGSRVALVTALLAGLFSVATLQAQPTHTPGSDARSGGGSRALGSHGGDVRAFLNQFDVDGTGSVDFATFERFRRQRYAETDTDGDGSLDVEEYVQEYADRLEQTLEQGRNGQLEQTHARFKALDRDGSGYIERSEYQESGERSFARYTALLAEAPGNPQTQAPPRRRDPLRMPTTHTVEGLLALYDSDGDGVLERDEYDTARLAAFERTDTDRDGRLSLDEYLSEFEQRLDRQIENVRSSSERQTRVRFDALDTDKDGRVDWDEYAASGRRIFERTDYNADGRVDAEDFRLQPSTPVDGRSERRAEGREATAGAGGTSATRSRPPR